MLQNMKQVNELLVLVPSRLIFPILGAHKHQFLSWLTVFCKPLHLCSASVQLIFLNSGEFGATENQEEYGRPP